MKDFNIELKEGDSLYGLTVTSFNPPAIHLREDNPISGTLEWQIHYDLPRLIFLPDVPVPEKYKRDFWVKNSDALPIRNGAKVRATVEDMRLVFMESNMPSGVDLKNVEIVGELYESISETSKEWQYYLQLKREDPNNPQLQ